jgi:hypothetical protein
MHILLDKNYALFDFNKKKRGKRKGKREKKRKKDHVLVRK